MQYIGLQKRHNEVQLGANMESQMQQALVAGRQQQPYQAPPPAHTTRCCIFIQ